MKKLYIIILLAIAGLLFFRKDIGNMARMSGDRWNRLIPTLKIKVLGIIEECKRQDLDVMFWDGWRSPEEEQEHINSGASKLKDPYNTKHLWGFAVDIIFMTELGTPTWEASNEQWEKLRSIARSYGLITPISWDKPHMELPDFNLASIRKEYGNDYNKFLKDRGVIA